MSAAVTFAPTTDTPPPKAKQAKKAHSLVNSLVTAIDAAGDLWVKCEPMPSGNAGYLRRRLTAEHPDIEVVVRYHGHRSRDGATVWARRIPTVATAARSTGFTNYTAGAMS